MNLRKRFLILSLFVLSLAGSAQVKDSIRQPIHFSGSVSVTHNGIALVPTFSLERPAAIFLLSTGKGRLSFEPDLRFALEGKPWSFLFWWRYKLVNAGKIKVTLGAHPAINFRTMKLPVNGDSMNVLVARRFLAGELAPNYFVAKNISVGVYYLYSRGFDKTVARNNHFITLNTQISNIPLPGQWYMRVHPQVYYLKQDKRDGFFFTSSLSLARRNFPLSVSAIINKRIEADIPGSRDFVWNASLVYSFNKKYARQ